MASSSIASQQVKWGIEEAKQYLGTDWTKDQTVWERVLNELKDIPNLKNIHFMGGETLLTKRFEDFVDFMIDHKRFDLHFSFVTNGTTFNESLMDKLSLFSRVGIEVSIETITEHNSYQRQGTNTDQVLSNLERYLEYCDGTNITVTARPAVGLLSIGYYHTLLQYCLDKNIIVKSMTVIRPPFLDAKILPRHIKDRYIAKYLEFLNANNLNDLDISKDFNESDPFEVPRIIKQQAVQCISMLEQPGPNDSESLLTKMVRWCERWDRLSTLDARLLYPEFSDILDKNDYQV
jgi:MoaA/NifB/PqqE/SkfB family radical SAM enzyme